MEVNILENNTWNKNFYLWIFIIVIRRYIHSLNAYNKKHINIQSKYLIFKRIK